MWIILAVLGVVVGVPFVLGIVAAIAIPAMMRARMSANETAAIAALRTLASYNVAPADPTALDDRTGYQYRFARWSPDRFTYWASPSVPGSTGTRRFCVDQRGVVFQYRLDDAWIDPAPPEAHCPPSGIPVDAPGR